MKLKFTNPCPNGESLGSSFLNKSKIKYSTERGNAVLCPYDGKIIDVNSNSVTITHNIKGDEWESELSGFYPDVKPNQQIYGGKQIGFTKDGQLSFEVTPSVNLEELLSTGINSSSYYGKSSKDNEEKRNRSTDSVDSGMYNILLSPFTFINTALKLNKSKDLNEQEVQEKTTLINEEISRMKKLF